MRNVGIGLSGVLLVGWWTRAPAQEDVDFRLPFSGGREVIRSNSSTPGPRDLFNQKYGKAGGVVFWDEKLESPRFISPRTKIPIARPDATESELIESARNFVDANSPFFGVSGKDLIDPAVRWIRRHALVVFAQAVEGVEIRGANVRVLIGPEGQLASVDAFLLREPSLPEPSYLDENEVLDRARELIGLEIGALGRQVIFPSGSPSSARFGYCLEAIGPGEGDAHEVFFSSDGELLGMVDPSHGFCEVPVVVKGFSTNPDDIFTTADQAGEHGDLYPLPSVKVLSMNWNGVTDDSGVTTICSPFASETVWTELVLGSPVGPQLACPEKDGAPNVIRHVVEIFHGNSKSLEPFVPVSLFDPSIRFPICTDKPIHLTFNPTVDAVEAFHLLVYHHIRRLDDHFAQHLSNIKLEKVKEDSLPLRVRLDDAIVDVPPEYTATAKEATLKLGPMMKGPGGTGWVPPTIVHHEYAHHVINTVVHSNQGDGFVEGLADAITIYLNENPRIGYTGPEYKGTLGFHVEEPLLKAEFGNDEAKARLRRLTGRTFWRILSRARGTTEKGKVIDLLYFWMSLRQVNNRGQIAFDGSKVLLEQLLVADDSVDFEGGNGDGNILNGTNRQEYILAGFQDKDDEWGLFHTPFVRGDVDRDGSLDLSDAVILLSYLFLGGADGYRCPVAMDVDDNEEIDLTDAINLLSYQFLGGAQPQPPFPGCGLDPTPGLFWCVEEPRACRQ